MNKNDKSKKKKKRGKMMASITGGRVGERRKHRERGVRLVHRARIEPSIFEQFVRRESILRVDSGINRMVAFEFRVHARTVRRD